MTLKRDQYRQGRRDLVALYDRVKGYVDLKEAIEPLEKAKELMALSPAPHFYLGASYLAVGQNNQARAAYEQGISRAETLDNEESNRVIDSAISRLRILISESPQIEAPATTFITMLEAAKADN